MPNQRKSFATGAIILAIGGLLGKVLGAFYRVWLTGLIGLEGMGYYGIAYPIYSALLAVSSAGVPVAISRLVAQQVELDKMSTAKRIFHVACAFLAVVGLVACLALFGLSFFGVVGDESIRPCLMAISGALLFVAVISAFRGYFQGQQQMLPTTLSQIIEQLGKLLFSFALAGTLYNRYLPQSTQLAAMYGAAGALLGLTVSEGVALLYLFVQYLVTRNRSIAADKKVRSSEVIKALLIIAVPVSIGSVAASVSQLVDSMMVPARLKAAGFLEAEATSMFGLLGNINTIIAMPTIVTLAISTSLMPAITRALTVKDISYAKRSALSGYKLALLIGLPAAIGIFMLADPILELLFGNAGKLSAADLALGGSMLRVMAVVVLCTSIVQGCTGTIQAFGRPIYLVYTMLIAAVVKAVMNYLLVANPALNIIGASYASVISYGIMAVLDTVIMLRLTRARMKVLDMFVRPGICAAGMGGAVWLWIRFLGVESRLMTLLAVCVAVGVYGVLLLVTRALNEDDLTFLPGGKYLRKLMGRPRA